MAGCARWDFEGRSYDRRGRGTGVDTLYPAYIPAIHLHYCVVGRLVTERGLLVGEQLLVLRQPLQQGITISESRAGNSRLALVVFSCE